MAQRGAQTAQATGTIFSGRNLVLVYSKGKMSPGSVWEDVVHSVKNKLRFSEAEKPRRVACHDRLRVRTFVTRTA